MQTLWYDLRYALRQLRGNLGFTLIAVASLALAIGANTSIFSFANRMLYMRLGVPHAEELRAFTVSCDDRCAVHDSWGSDYPGDDGRHYFDSFSYPVYQQLRQKPEITGPLFAFKRLERVNVTAAGSAQVVDAELVSGNYYGELQVQPLLGRLLTPADDGAPGSGTVAVISDGFWHRAFGGAADVLGKTILVNMAPLTIVGVNPAGFAGAEGVSDSAPDVYVPLSMIAALHPGTGEDDPQGNSLWWLQLMARSKPGVPAAQAQAAEQVALEAAVRATMPVKKDETMPRPLLEDGSRGSTFGTRDLVQPLHVLLGFAGLVLVLACANIANLMLARASTRQREMGVRMALGATGRRILRQMLTESLLLSALGGAAGLLLGYAGRNLIPWLMATADQGSRVQVGFDWRVYAFAAAVTLLTGLVFGVAPAVAAMRAEPIKALKEGARGASRRRRSWSGKAIVGFQVALSTLLVIAAMFFLRTLVNLNAIDPGFSAKDLLLFDINPPASRYTGAKGVVLHQRLEAAFAAVPGVQGVSLTTVPLVAGNLSRHSFHIEGAKEAPTKRGDDRYSADSADVGASFFPVMSIPLVAGRGFTAQDTTSSVPVSVINQALARRFFPGVNPVGKRFRRATDGPGAAWFQIVGVCADTRYNDMRTEPPPIHFDLYGSTNDIDGATYLLRSPLPAGTLVPALRRAVAQVDPDLPLSNVRTQQQQIGDTLQQERLFASLTAGFGLLALALASVGIYGIMAYTVAQRRSEIGIRLALGAMRSQMRTMVLRETGWLAGCGLAIGLAVALALVRLVKSMLYGVSAADPVTLCVSVLLLAAVVLVASLIPAERAASVDPIEALRSE